LQRNAWLFKVVMAGSSALALCAVGGCTRIQEADTPPPPPPAAEPARPAPRRAPPPSSWSTSRPLVAAARPDAAPIPVPSESLNGDPKGLKREAIGTALQDALPSLAPCLQGEGASVGLSFNASPEGRAEEVKITGASPAAERCVSARLAQVKLPSFEGKAVPVQFPLNVYRPPAPRPAEPPPPPPAAPAVPTTAQSTGVYAPAPSQTTTAAPPSGTVFVQP
jgi:hypothetical protein